MEGYEAEEGCEGALGHEVVKGIRIYEGPEMKTKGNYCEALPFSFSILFCCNSRTENVSLPCIDTDLSETNTADDSLRS